ncbi:hypothetical protein SAMN05661080_02793 [Modestobacter sp. DSM 44400]|uniref:hypothetical protein n=1 Tax=Modestobacter sp. DSM 44400 TaxID=1550230 RepID=UPI00089CB249|nr:hypothetical protein [Modestobacter sp. DSM 44400]SDY23453.1 hypothetical protein SAMN05661080_02793 [Modestobacter sp. DSM 44400]
MSSPHDRDGFDDRGPGDWQEPEHLAEGGGEGTGAADRPADPPNAAPGPSTGSTAWQPPGWDLPTVEPERSTIEPAVPQSQPPAPDERQDDALPPAEQAPSGPRGLFGPRRRREPGAAEQVFRRETDPVGVQAWALHHGWVASDGTGPQDAPLVDLVRSAPVRPAKEDCPGNVVRGRGMGLDLVAFDVVYETPRYAVPRWAVTAAPVLGDVPSFRLTPARFWKHRTGGLLQVPSGDPEFDLRWVLLAAVDGPQVRRVVEDPVVRQLLLGTDDGDELWSAAGFVAAVRPDGHRPQLIEHHARLLAVVVGALAAAA